MNQYVLINTAWRYIITTFFIGAVFGCFCAYVWTDDARIEQEQQVMFYTLLVEADAMLEMEQRGRPAQYLYDRCGKMHELACHSAFLLNGIFGVLA